MTESKPLSEMWQQFKKDIREREFQKKLVFSFFEAGVLVTLLLTYLFWLFIPILKHVETYEKVPGYDPIIALSSIGFTMLALWFTIGPLPTMIIRPIHKLVFRK